MTIDPTPPDPPAARESRGASIGLVHGAALYVCAVLGAGVIVLPGQVASSAGPASLAAWGFSALLGVPLAFTFAALASRFPDAGGVATYAGRAFGPVMGGVGGWWFFLAGSIGQTIVPLTAGYYVAAALGTGQRWAPAIAALVLGVAVLTNLVGIRVGARVQIGLALGVAAILAGVVTVGLPQVRAEEFTPLAPHGIEGIGQAAVVLLFAFAGWEAIAHLSAEFRDVRRDLPLATLLTVLVVSVLYLGVAFVVIGTGAYGSPEVDRLSLGIVVERGLGLSAAGVVAASAVVVCLGTTTAFIASVSRLGGALGRDGWAPRSLARENRWGVPGNAVLAVGAIGGGGLLGAAVLGWGTDDIVFVPAVLVLATYLVSAAAAVRLFRGRRRVVALCALVPLLASVPFAGGHLLVPSAVACAVMLVQRTRHRRRVTDLHGTVTASPEAGTTGPHASTKPPSWLRRTARRG